MLTQAGFVEEEVLTVEADPLFNVLGAIVLDRRCL